MTAVTGETGAGKTLVVEAIELLVGGRADPGMVRPGATEAGRGPLRRPATRTTRSCCAGCVPASGRSRAYVERPPRHRRRRWPSGASASSTSTASTPTSRSSRPRCSAGALDRFGGIDLRAAAHRPQGRWPRSRSALAASAATSASGPGRSTSCASRSTSSAAAGLTDAGRGRAPRRRGGASWPTPPAHREAAAAAVRRAHGRRGAPPTPWPRPWPRSPAARRSPRPRGRLRGRRRRAGRRRRRAARDRARASRTTPSAWPRSRARRQLLHELRRKYGETPRRGASALRRRRRAARLAELEAATIGGPPRSTPTATAALRRARRGRRGGGRRPRAAARRPRWPRRSRPTCAELAMPKARRRGRRSAGDGPGDDVALPLRRQPGHAPAAAGQGGLGRRAGPDDAGPAPRADRGPARRSSSTRSTPASAARRPWPWAARWPRLGATTTRCSSSPTCPRWRRSPTRRCASTKETGEDHTVATDRTARRATAGGRAVPDAVRTAATSQTARDHASELLADGHPRAGTAPSGQARPGARRPTRPSPASTPAPSSS